jgi:hypothetical protein
MLFRELFRVFLRGFVSGLQRLGLLDLGVAKLLLLCCNGLLLFGLLPLVWIVGMHAEDSCLHQIVRAGFYWSRSNVLSLLSLPPNEGLWFRSTPDSAGKLGNSNFSRYSNRVGRVTGPAKRGSTFPETSMYAVSPLPVLPFK